MFVLNQSIPYETIAEGTQRRILAHCGQLMVTEVSFKKNIRGERHSHPHEQISYILKGSFQYEIEGKTEILSAGDSCYVKPNQQHSVYSLEDNSVILDAFTPQREDFLH